MFSPRMPLSGTVSDEAAGLRRVGRLSDKYHRLAACVALSCSLYHPRQDDRIRKRQGSRFFVEYKENLAWALCVSCW